MEEDGFTLHAHRKGKKSTVRRGHPVAVSCPDRSDVTEAEVERALAWANTKTQLFSDALAVDLRKVVGGRRVAQLQLYGIGPISDRRHSGPLQLDVALRLTKLLSPEGAVSLFFQEPCLAPAERRVLSDRGFNVQNGTDFTSDHFEEAKSGSKKDEEAVLVCYMIHGDWCMLDAFLTAHWKPEYLRSLIVVGNVLKDLSLNPHYATLPAKVRRYAELCRERKLCVDRNSELWEAFHLTGISWLQREQVDQLFVSK